MGGVTSPRLPALAPLLILLVAGCAGEAAPTQDAGHPPHPTGAAVRLAGADLVVYDRALAPEGAAASASVDSSSTGTLSSLTVEGLLPGRGYGAHLHANPCGTRPDDAGPHFQHTHGQVNATSEIWLDLTTDADGAGNATAKHTWALGAAVPRSAVIHAQPTKADGTAGPRVACLTLRQGN